jgi:hypothetical protein
VNSAHCGRAITRFREGFFANRQHAHGPPGCGPTRYGSGLPVVGRLAMGRACTGRAVVGCGRESVSFFLKEIEIAFLF